MKQKARLNSFPLAGMKDWLRNIFQLKNELFAQEAVDCCLRKRKMGPTSQKIISLIKR